MNKVKISGSKHSLVRFLSLGVVVIGVGCIAYAMFNIWSQSGYSMNDKTVIVPMDRAVLTVTTCYPFNFIGPAPDRYIVSADLVKNR